ncbi:phosphoglycerate dehydrogenase [Lacticaseibacillus manihotivorans]|jgi:D-3-phosphoglycerate dehydrogenase|uniref:D-3-phosphoglycerate dehydrogenase n=2 Tax=Lacticaseibacillus manihotivorans TaxID=88233 RepID=A0A0R1QTD9_9LACO|nr:phosphoglycerate dehydrogenase [Lacticaseibacillus manihotivorans]KRL44539.1 phosphoglycerate dehydrogenase [Lacticaseibacillus manihotivorans DSM 13343 = JCM 12514]QFQ92693.1 3-phosphoglycerate dehydrogenase [Lacticaseibacillus manihotivorans]
MYNVKTFNAIAQEGLDEFHADYQLNQTDDADAFLIRSVDLHGYDFPKNLKAIVRCGAGFNNIPLDVATENGTAVFNTPGSNANAVKELVVAMLIIASRNLFSAAQYAAQNSGADISTRTEREKTQFNGTELTGKTLAVIGVGHVGARVATAAGALGMHVIGYDPYLSANDAWHIPTTTKRAATLEEALVNADYVSVHVPKNSETTNMISTKEIALMPKGTVLLNFARGGIVDNHAVVEALDAGHLKRYMTDFGEPEILNRKDVLVTPHIGGSTLQAEANGAVQGADTIMTFLETGNVMHSVNLPSLEVPFVGKYRLTIMHQNIPNMVGQIATLLAGADVNIESMSNAARDKVAYSIIDTNNEFDFDDVVEKLEAIDAVYRVRLLKK